MAGTSHRVRGPKHLFMIASRRCEYRARGGPARDGQPGAGRVRSGARSFDVRCGSGPVTPPGWDERGERVHEAVVSGPPGLPGERDGLLRMPRRVVPLPEPVLGFSQISQAQAGVPDGHP